MTLELLEEKYNCKASRGSPNYWNIDCVFLDDAANLAELLIKMEASFSFQEGMLTNIYAFAFVNLLDEIRGLWE